MKLRKKTTLALLLLISLVLPVLLSGCIPSENWYKFTEHGEKDLYTCTLNSTTEFWYSPTYLYGEWIKDDETVPMTINFSTGTSAEPETNCVLRFHDEYGSCMAELVMEMNKFRTNRSKSVCEAAGELIVYDVEKEEMLQSLVDGIKFVGKTVYKTEKGNMPAYTPIQQSIFDFLAQGEPGFYCEEFNLWFNSTSNYSKYLSCYVDCEKLVEDEWKNFSAHVEKDTFTFYDYSMPRLLMVCLDENGYFLRNKINDEILCKRLEKATAETDARTKIPYRIFINEKDEQGNYYRFVCESEGFFINGDTNTGILENGTQILAIQMDCYTSERVIAIVTEVADTMLDGIPITKRRTIIYAHFAELLEDGSARFTVTRYSGAFPPTEIILKKELIESQN